MLNKRPIHVSDDQARWAVWLRGGGGGGHLNVTWQGGAHFLRISTTRFGKKFAFRYPVSEFLDYKTIKIYEKPSESVLFMLSGNSVDMIATQQ